MRDEPGIVKEMRKTEKLWKFKASSRSSYEDLETSEELPEDMSDENIFEDKGEKKAREDNIDHKKSDDESLETYNYLEKLFNYANVPIIVWNPTFRIIRFNPAFERLTGRSANEVVGTPLDILFPKDSREKSLDLIHRTAMGEKWETVEIPIIHTDGTVRTILWNSATLYATDGTTVVATIAQGIDITERKLMEEKLLVSNNMSLAVLNATHDSVFLIDTKGTIHTVNETASRILGKSTGELISMCIYDLFPPDIGKSRMAIIEEVIHTRKATHAEDNFDKEKFFDTSCYPIFDTQGNVEQVAVFVENITERKKAYNALQESEKRFHDIALCSADWIWEVDKDGKYTFASGKVKQILGYDSEELIGKTPFDLMPEDEARHVGEVFKRIASEKKMIVDLENWNLTKQGEKVCLLTNGVPILGESGELVGYRGVDKDITERRKAEDKLKEKIDELERYKKVTVGRELRLIELKKELKELKTKLQDGG